MCRYVIVSAGRFGAVSMLGRVEKYVRFGKCGYREYVCKSM
jgi:hypothetical protein